ncbi:MAG: hypothetical protein Q7R33_01895 [Nitrosarchaeum sp.]|nr:hypothetical protein [Nitrosarchaeum sp.]
MQQIKKNERPQRGSSNVLKENVKKVKAEAGVGIMKHADGTIEKRKF